MAQKDLRALLIGASVQSSDASKAHQNRLVIELGTVQTVQTDPRDEERDEAGFKELQTMAH